MNYEPERMRERYDVIHTQVERSVGSGRRDSGSQEVRRMTSESLEWAGLGILLWTPVENLPSKKQRCKALNIE